MLDLSRLGSGITDAQWKQLNFEFVQKVKDTDPEVWHNAAVKVGVPTELIPNPSFLRETMLEQELYGTKPFNSKGLAEALVELGGQYIYDHIGRRLGFYFGTQNLIIEWPYSDYDKAYIPFRLNPPLKADFGDDNWKEFVAACPFEFGTQEQKGWWGAAEMTYPQITRTLTPRKLELAFARKKAPMPTNGSLVIGSGNQQCYLSAVNDEAGLGLLTYPTGEVISVSFENLNWDGQNWRR